MSSRSNWSVAGSTKSASSAVALRYRSIDTSSSSDANASCSRALPPTESAGFPAITTSARMGSSSSVMRSARSAAGIMPTVGRYGPHLVGTNDAALRSTGAGAIGNARAAK